MTFDEMTLIGLGITYKTGWSITIAQDKHRANAPYLQWIFVNRCAKTGYEKLNQGRKWYLSSHMTESELVFTAFKAALTAEEHECREFFNYKSKRIFNPHVDVNALMSVCDQEDVRDEERMNTL